MLGTRKNPVEQLGIRALLMLHGFLQVTHGANAVADVLRHIRF